MIRRWIALTGGELLAGNFQQSQRLISEPRQFRFLVDTIDVGPVQRVLVIVIVGNVIIVVAAVNIIAVDELAVLVHPYPADIRDSLTANRSVYRDFGFELRLDEVTRQHLAQHQVRIRTAEAETGHAGDGSPAVAGPIGDSLGDLEVFLVEVDVWVWAGVVDRRRNLVVAQRERRFCQACRTCSRFQMSHIGFHRT